MSSAAPSEPHDRVRELQVPVLVADDENCFTGKPCHERGHERTCCRFIQGFCWLVQDVDRGLLQQRPRNREPRIGVTYVLGSFKFL
jgi:hypothetical protein